MSDPFGKRLFSRSLPGNSSLFSGRLLGNSGLFSRRVNIGLGVTVEKKRGTSPEEGGPQACMTAGAPAPGP